MIPREIDMPKFSIRTMLIFVAFLGLGLTALMNPNKMWHDIFTFAEIWFVVLLIPVIIGSKGKFRRRIFSFAVLCGGSIFASDFYSDSQFIQSQSCVFGWLLDFFGSTEVITPDGEYLSSRNSNYYISTSDPGGNRVLSPISLEEIESRGLTRYVVDRDTGVHSVFFYGICRSIFAISLGFLGYLITGWVYDRQNKQPEP